MFKKLDISNFGIYKDFEWKSHVKNKGNQEQFLKKLNIIYGRNYSGKTTVSRIFRSFETGILPEKFNSPDFTLCDYDKKEFDASLEDNDDYTIRVYNKDFVHENLRWLIDESDGEIKPFAVLGEGNVKTEKEIETIKEELGDEAEKKGILYEVFLKNKDFTAQEIKVVASKKKINDQLKNKANEKIKYDFNLPNYNITSIKKDISEILKSKPNKLNKEQKEEKKNLLKETVKNEIDQVDHIDVNLKVLSKKVLKLCNRRITPTKPIQDLLNNVLLQNWAQEGIVLHKSKRKTCGFCQQPLPDDLWEKLSKHFSEESQLLEEEIDTEIENLNDNLNLLQNYLKIEENDFYKSLHKPLKNALENWSLEVEKIENYIIILINALKKRRNDIFNSFEIDIEDQPSIESINVELNSINTLIQENNNKSLTLGSDKTKAQEDLRINVVNEFLTDIDYIKTVEKIKVEEKKLERLEGDLEKVQEKKQKKYDAIKALELELKDEKNGVAKVNEYLSHFFGEKSLALEAQESYANDEKPVYQFVLQRNGEEASNLSEGESSLIAFCYFLAKLEDINTKNKEIIIWLDDPISSLDNNHIFFVFSLIENLITKPKNYKQLFISTHNLDLLKYLKRLSYPMEEITLNGVVKKVPDVNHLIIERTAENSCIKLMPNYLKQYITEFNYLFDQIFKCYQTNESEENFHIFYNFGNNLRKFLEAYLFYKYPNRAGNTERLKQFIGDDTTSTTIIERINNELSHLEEIFDRSMSPIEIPEIKKLATFILKKMCAKDEEQLRALLSSINKKKSEINTIIEELK